LSSKYLLLAYKPAPFMIRYLNPFHHYILAPAGIAVALCDLHIHKILVYYNVAICHILS
jgi:hypothetical protein